MVSKKITLNELRNIVKQIIKEEKIEKVKYFVDLIDGTITTGKIHPNYKGFLNPEEAENFSKEIKNQLKK